MKKMILISVLALLSVLTAFISMGREKKRNSLETQELEILWKEYGSAREADRPQKMASLLEDIKDVAGRKRCAWDYYHACDEYVNVKSMRNWKLRDSLEAAFRNEILAYDEPLLTVLMMLDDHQCKPSSVLEYIRSKSAELHKVRNSDVYRHRYIFSESDELYHVMLPLVGNDYEYALWEMLSKGGNDYDGIAGQIYDELKTLLGNEYPESGFADLIYALKHVPDTDGRRYDFMKSIEAGYSGRAFSLVPRQWMLRREFMSMKSREVVSEDYEKLRDSLEACEKERKSYGKGIDAEIAAGCKDFGDLLDILNDKGASVFVEDGKAELMLRNLDRIKIRISKGRSKVYETVLENHARSFYAYDTLRTDMPLLDDGNYTLEFYDGQNPLGKCMYEIYSLSLATRESADGKGLYVAEYLSGEPVGTVDLKLFKGDRLAVEVKDFNVDGFSALPQEMASLVGTMSSNSYLQAFAVDKTGRQMMSRKMFLPSSGFHSPARHSYRSVSVMTDRSAFNPGDTICFKAIAYDVAENADMTVLAEGCEIIMKLTDPQGKVMSEKPFRTNTFGSCAGEFILDEVERNGVFTLAAFVEGKRIGSKSFRVDEFVLPTFDLSFDEHDRLHLPGDTIIVSGKVFSFSGHNLSSAKTEAQIYKEGNLLSVQTLPLSRDGSFALSFEADCGEDSYYASYEIKVRITDATGETLEFSRFESVSRNMILDLRLENSADGTVEWPENQSIHNQCVILAEDTAELLMTVMRNDGNKVDCLVKYEVACDRSILKSGEAVSGVVETVDFADMPSGLYSVVARYSAEDGYGRVITAERTLSIMKVGDRDSVLKAPVENLIRVLPGDAPAVMFGAGNGPVWALFELFSDEGRLIRHEIVHLEGEPEKDGSLTVKRYERNGECTDAVRLNIFYFHNGGRYFWTHVWTRPEPEMNVPLEITRFTEKALPSSEYTVSLKTLPQTELLASVFDVATEKIMPNVWNVVRKMDAGVADVGIRSDCGRNSNGFRSFMGGPIEEAVAEDAIVVGFGSRRAKAFTGAVRNMAADMASVEEAAAVPDNSVQIREDFATTLVFEPFLRPDSDGNIDLRFTTSDKLSTFVVSLFVHDRKMNNSVLRRDMHVTLPVKVSVNEPQYLHQGDRYVLKASLSNNSKHELKGVMTIELYDVKDYRNARPFSIRQTPLAVDAEAVSDAEFEIDVPQADTLGIKISFAGGYEPEGMAVCDVMVQDAVFVGVPVFPAQQILTEAHSAVLLPGLSEDETLGSLRERFVNVSSAGAEYNEVSIMDMLRDALPLVKEAEGKDVISQSEAMYINLLGGALRIADSFAEGPSYRDHAVAAMAAAGKILACANADGGFGWFEGMMSSPVVTAVVLERYAGLRDRGVLSLVSEELGEDALEDFSEAMVEAVKYLDRTYFDSDVRPSWYGGLSQLQYMSVRSMYTAIPFDAASARKTAGKDRWNDFTKGAKELLMPGKKERWTEGAVLAKARMIRIISALRASDSGSSLASSWGLRNMARMARSLDTEMVSLLEYAVEHPSGGTYYPNAVIPWRGLLESEAYAHAYIADLLGEKADGIRIWLMLQKETQQWSDDPGFIEALASVYDGSQEVRSTRIMMLKKRYIKPFDEIKAAGNGMKVNVRYYKELPVSEESSKSDRIEIAQGDSLKVGDRIIAVYSLWSGVNRSFVRLTVPRAASLRPVAQLSGWAGGLFRRISYGSRPVSPYCYREVRSDRTHYWVDVFPEENTTFEEELFITQEGSFVTPAPEIECLYAPHYRANDDGGRIFISNF